jgi:hypothetical protein
MALLFLLWTAATRMRGLRSATARGHGVVRAERVLGLEAEAEEAALETTAKEPTSSAGQAPKWTAVSTTRIKNGIATASSFSSSGLDATPTTGDDIDAR